MNAFYASVEMMLDPSLRGKPVAVCGSTENRHGIVLAKSQLAKKAGVKTGMVNWEARQRCPGLIMVPPQYFDELGIPSGYYHLTPAEAAQLAANGTITAVHTGTAVCSPIYWQSSGREMYQLAYYELDHND